MKAGAIIVAAGKGRRMKGREKLFHPLNDVPLLALTLGAYQEHPDIDVVVLAANDRVRNRFEKEIRKQYGISKVITVVPGGARRQDSVFNGLHAFPEPPGVVLIHDGDRPFVTGKIISAVLDSVRTGGAIAAVRAKDTLKWVNRKEYVIKTLDREVIWIAQTPQGFPYQIILEAHKKARAEGWEVTDDASMVERMGGTVRVVEGSYDNIKITTPEDIVLAEAIYQEKWGMGNGE